MWMRLWLRALALLYCCSGIIGKELQGGATAGSQRATVAYGIMIYQREGYTALEVADQLGRLLDALYDESNVYVLHVDSKSEQALLDAVTEMERSRPNVFQIKSESVSWGGISVVERTLALMQTALEKDEKWSYFVNLGHEDYPLASQDEVARSLADAPSGTNFIKCWPIEGYDFFGQWEGHSHRVTGTWVDDFSGLVTKTNHKRTSTDKSYNFYKSLQQMTLSREFVSHAVTSIASRRLLLLVANSMAPDEIFFPTLLQQSDHFASTATCDDTRHFSYWIRPGDSWHPEYLTLDNLPQLVGLDELFIRKVSPKEGSTELLALLDRRREGHGLTESLPALQRWLEDNSLNLEEAMEELTSRTKRHAKAVLDSMKAKRKAQQLGRSSATPGKWSTYRRKPLEFDGSDWLEVDERDMAMRRMGSNVLR